MEEEKEKIKKLLISYDKTNWELGLRLAKTIGWERRDIVLWLVNMMYTPRSIDDVLKRDIINLMNDVLKE